MADDTFLDRVIATTAEVMPDLADELRLLTRDITDDHQALIQIADHLQLLLSTPLRSAFKLSDYLEKMELNPRNAFVEMREVDTTTRERSVFYHRLLPEPVLTERRTLLAAIDDLDAFTSTLRYHFSDPDPDPESNPNDGFQPSGGSSPIGGALKRNPGDLPESSRTNTPFRRKRKGL